MTLAHARALFPPNAPVGIAEHQPERDAAALRSLAAWMLRYSPAVAVDPPAGLMADIRGCGPLFGGAPRHIRLMRQGLARLGFASRIAAAPTFACAWGAARYGAAEAAVIAPGAEMSAVGDLPVAALRLDADVIEALAEVGIERVGHVMDLASGPSRSEAPARFGADALLRLDAVMGRAIEAIDPVRPPPPLIVERCFDGPTASPEAVALAARGLVEDCRQELIRRGAGARRVTITLARVDAAPVALSAALSRPSRDAKHLWSLLAPKVEVANLGFGVDRVALEASRLARLSHAQARRWDEDEAARAEADRAAGELVDALAARLGASRVLRTEASETHVPERAFRPRPAGEGARRSPAWPAVTLMDRPAALLSPPEAARVMALTPDGPVSWVEWRGRAAAVTACAGPERIAAEWWRTPGPAYERAERDYFRVGDSLGRWLWLCREPDARWTVRGVWA